ncbi:hypothetical protein Tco_0828328 [Tanacetum coccineum]
MTKKDLSTEARETKNGKSEGSTLDAGDPIHLLEKNVPKPPRDKNKRSISLRFLGTIAVKEDDEKDP